MLPPLTTTTSIAAAVAAVAAAPAIAAPMAAAPAAAESIALTSHWAAPAAVAVFVVAYLVVMAEERLGIRKSLPVMVAAGLVWILAALAFGAAGRLLEVEAVLRHDILDFAELFLFLLAAMTFVNTMEERGLFEALRNWLINRRLSLRTLFWVSGALAFMISPVADNLTTALVIGAVVLAVGEGKPKFISLSCISIVVAANAGGAFSPFGDITTLMVWQKGKVAFTEFFALCLPSLVNWLVPAGLMSLGIEKGLPDVQGEKVLMKSGALTVLALLIGTIALAVSLHNYLHLPPVLGMMTGLGVLNVYAYWLKRRLAKATLVPLPGQSAMPETEADDMPEPDEIFADSGFEADPSGEPHATARGTEAQEETLAGTFAETVAESVEETHGKALPGLPEVPTSLPVVPDRGPPTGALPALSEALRQRRLRLAKRQRRPEPLDVLRQMERTEWDTLMFFYGVILCVGGLGALGYLAGVSHWLYGDLGPTWANVLVGILSAVVDNIPIMFAVLSMDPAMSHGQWLLVTLTAGVGGSLLSIGSAAGVALMGQAKGVYTFMSHLKWTWAVALGYAASVALHLLINRALF